MTNDDILYELIVKTNLPFKMDIISDVHVKFTAPKVCITKVFDEFVYTNYDVSKHYTSNKLDIEIIMMLFDMAVDHEVQEHYRKIVKLKNMKKESEFPRNGKFIAHLLNLNHSDLKDVGANILIFVNHLYTNTSFTLKERAVKDNLLQRFIEQFNIIPESVVYLMTTEKYKEYVKSGRKDEKLWL